MDRASKLPVLTRRQKRRTKAKSPVLRIWAALVSSFLALLLMLIVVPIAGAGIGTLYLMERTPPQVDQLLEGILVETVGLYARYFYDGQLPPPDAVETGTLREFKTTRIYDRTGEHLLYEVYDPRGGNRQIVPLERIPEHLLNATIALEDKTFYENPGVDLRGIARAAYQNWRSGEIVAGGSSITQQVVKNVAIAPEERFEQDYDRKIKELILAIELSRRYDKDKILEWYLNVIPYGRRAYGVQAAAQEYFGKDVSQLTLAESAMLAMLPNQPAFNDPFLDPDRAKKRQEIVLRRMYEEKYISYDKFQEALAEPVLEHLVRPSASDFFKAPHFVIHVQRLLEERFGTDLLYRGGLKVITSLDYELFKRQEQLAREHVAALREKGIDASNAAVVTIDPKTGEILSMVGSLDYSNAEIDGAINMAVTPRMPGSSIKPYTYLAAFIEGYTPASMVWDVRTVFKDGGTPYVPENYSRTYNGPVLFRDALQRSLNIPAVKVMDMVGIDTAIDVMHRMGINTLRREEVGLALTLGGGEVTLLDHTYAFSVLANSGLMAGQPIPPVKRRPGYRQLNPAAILHVEDARGEVLYEYEKPTTQEVISPQHAYLMQDILSDNEARIPDFGEDNPLVLPDRPVAAKTGTTNNFHDGWTLGFTPQYVTGVWIGNADYRPMGADAPGLKVAAPLWQRIMQDLHKDKPVKEWPVPPGILQVQVCATSGLLPTKACPRVKTEIFIEGTQPTTPDNLHHTFRICGDSGRLATVYCPPNQVRSRVFMMVPPEAEDWARENNVPLPPTAYDSSHGPSVAGGPVSITSPSPYGYVSGTTSIKGSAYVPPTEIAPEPQPTATGEGEGEAPEGQGDNPATATPKPVEINNFLLYRIEVGQGLDPSSWVRIGPEHGESVQNGNLEYWDTRGFDNGLYTLQLTVVHKDGTVQRSAIQVYVDNTPPEVSIRYPQPDTVHPLGGDYWLNIQADASDNIAMDRVEFYVDGQLIESSRSSFAARWTRDQAGLASGEEREVEIYAVAIDAAGNRTESERVRVRVRGQ